MSTTLNFTVEGLLVAGGRSRRMGTDKRLLELAGVPLWERQLHLLRSLPLTKVTLSTDDEFPVDEIDVTVLRDPLSDCGPLAGLARGLANCDADSLLVLAVDMPRISPEFLRRLIHRATESGAGVIPVGPDGWEPLAAIYPREALALADSRLARRDLALQPLVSALVESGLAVPYELAPTELLELQNLNTMEEWNQFLRAANGSATE